MTWRTQAACAGHTHLFYLDATTAPRGRNAPDIDPWAHARTICDTCPVQAECLADALATRDTHGFRAGHDPDALDRMARNQGGTIARVCDWCGDPYMTAKYSGLRRYCGDGCSKQALRKARREYNQRARGAVA